MLSKPITRLAWWYEDAMVRKSTLPPMRSDVLDVKPKTALKPAAMMFGQVPHAPLLVFAGSGPPVEDSFEFGLMVGLLVQAVLASLQEESIPTSRVITPDAQARPVPTKTYVSPALDVSA